MTPKTPNATLDRALWAIVGVSLFGLTGLFTWRSLARNYDWRNRTADFDHFYWAAEAMNQGRDLYSSGEHAYIYPPLLAWLLTPFAHLPSKQAFCVWLVVEFGATAVSLVVFARHVAVRLGLRPEGLLIASVCALSLFANIEQIRCEFEMGQSDTLVLLGFALGLAFLDKKPWLAGIALGFAFNIKYQSLLALPYLLLRRRWSAAASMAASSLAFLFLPALSQGWSANLRSISVAFAGMLNKVGLGPGDDITKAANLYPIDYHRSLSITSAAARLTDGVNHPGRMELVIVAAALVLLAVGWVLYRKRGVPLVVGRTPEADAGSALSGVVAIEWVGLIVVALAFSPHTTARHTFLMIPVHVLAFTMLVRPRPGVNPWPLALGTLAFTLGILLPPGGASWSETWVEAWRAIGGSVWCIILFYFTLVWTGLRYCAQSGSDSRQHPSGPALKRDAESVVVMPPVPARSGA